MDEHEFILTLQKRAKEQENLLKAVPLPKVFFITSVWLGKHPWRILIPLAFLLSLALRSVIGYAYTNAMLWLFRKL